MPGVVRGITMVGTTPSRWPAKATPCAWLPAEAVMTPRSSTSRDSPAILL